jgi:signal transduction histidine kinase
VKVAREKLNADFAAALREHLGGAGETALQKAYEAGRDALRAGLGLMDMATAHGTALATVQAASPDTRAAAQVTQRAGEILRESLTPFEMAQRGYQEAAGTLRELNAALQARARELSEAHAVVQANYEVIRTQRDALLRAQAQKEQLTTFVVHDLKNPLSGIVLNATALARDPGLDADQKESARHVLASAQTMNRMVLNLLDISKSEDGALLPRRGRVDLGALVEAVVATMRARVGDARQALSARVEGAVPPVSADPDLLRRVLENLLDNAMRYTPREGAIEVSLRSTEGGDAVEIRVHDAGPGIPAADRERVFEKYVQLDPGNSGHFRSGRGLGLLFCRLAVEAHAGRIWVEAGAPQGAVFCVRIPITE